MAKMVNHSGGTTERRPPWLVTKVADVVKEVCSRADYSNLIIAAAKKGEKGGKKRKKEKGRRAKQGRRCRGRESTREGQRGEM